MKKTLLLLCILGTKVLFSQVGIYTSSPQTTFHIDGAKDNSATGIPTAGQQTNDVVVTSSGSLGIGNIAPTSKVEITSGTNDVSGLKLTNLTSSTPIGIGQTIGVDTNGNVITLANALPASVATQEVATSTAATYLVNDLAWTEIPSTSQTMAIPVGGKAVFINFMLGIDYSNSPTGSGLSYYTAKLFIDCVDTNVYQTAQESGVGAQAQFNLSSVKFLTPGNHVLDIRMRRTFAGQTPSGNNIICRPISISFNASYIN